MTQRFRPSQKERRFVDFLHGLEERKERGALAALRRGLGRPPGDAPEMHRYVVAWAGGEPSRWREDAYYLVASLFALHPAPLPHAGQRSERATNLGYSFASLAQTPGSSAESVDRRFTALLGADREDLPQRLRHVVSLLKSRDVPVDWAQLLHDLKWWEDDDRRVQRRWAGAFWGQTVVRETQEGMPEGQDTDE